MFSEGACWKRSYMWIKGWGGYIIFLNSVLMCCSPLNAIFKRQIIEPSSEKTNIMASAQCYDTYQTKHATQAYADIHFSTPVDFLFQESLLYTAIPLRWNVWARISVCGLRRLILVDILRRGHNADFLAGRLISFWSVDKRRNAVLV